MSKMDNLRAMREAKYAEQQKRAAAAPSRPKAQAPVAPPAPKKVEERAVEATADTDDLCGHRNISGRTCTREKGHAAKSHRYS
ncbi:hypothetical protein SAMN04489844_1069 [Nocardioides exalbidus]|uniref:Uncharacterized protein n=1 Tax=Nocardioides exalbidus TaxID=402596 RepID=A0A1H4M8W7_9ACTN|nr:hypothetical protein [Nocardioides exalbidus]SEB79204.1 hypothetical protein SAMN04489844_1069 [Nocardioides exalbidus]